MAFLFTAYFQHCTAIVLLLFWLWQCIEHIFGYHWNLFRIFSIPHYLHLFSNGVKVQQMCLVLFLILNCHYCIDGAKSTFFRYVAPTLEDYLPLDEELMLPLAVNLGSVWGYVMALLSYMHKSTSQ